MRLLSVLLSVLSIYFIYKLGRIIFKKNLYLILVILLYAFSPLNIYYSQEVRMQNLNLFLCLGGVYYFFNFIRNPYYLNGLLYIVCTILSLYTHYFAFLILITEICVLIIFYLCKKIEYKTLKGIILYIVLINVLYIPWFPVFFAQIAKGQPWRTQQSITGVVSNVISYFEDVFFSTYSNPENVIMNYFSTFLSLFIITYLIFALVKIIARKSYCLNAPDTVILFVIVPLLIATLISFNQSIALSRYLSILIPFILFSLIYYSYKIYKKTTAVVIVAFLFTISGYGIYNNFSYNYKNNDYREVISYIESEFKNGDEIIAEPHYMGWFINYHINHNDSRLKNPSVLGWNLDMQIDSLAHNSGITNLWLILDYSSLEKENYDYHTELLYSLGYKIINSKSFFVRPAKVKVEYYVKKN